MCRNNIVHQTDQTLNKYTFFLEMIKHFNFHHLRQINPEHTMTEYYLYIIY